MSQAQPVSTPNPLRRERIILVLKEIVNELIGIPPEQIDLHANYLELGVESLVMIQFTQNIREKCGVKISLVQLYDEVGTLDKLAEYIDQKMPPGKFLDLLPTEQATVNLSPETSRQQRPEQNLNGQDQAIPQKSDDYQPVISVGTNAIRVPERQPNNRGSGVTSQTDGTPPSLTESPVRALSSPELNPPQTPSIEHLPASVNGGAVRAPTSVLERIMSQQLQVMAQQLQVFNSTRAPRPIVSGVEIPRSTPAEESERTVDPIETDTAADVEENIATAATEKAAGVGHDSGLQIKPEPYVPYQPIRPGSNSGLTPRQQEYLEQFIASHTKRTKESKKYTQTYRPFLADARNSVGFRLLWKELIYQIVEQRSNGSKVWDLDGNEYVDVTMGFGVHLFGHCPKFLIDAIDEQLKKGYPLGPQSHLAGKAAYLFCEMTGLDRAMFMNSGTEAVMAAMRIARTVTGRNKIAIFAGAYHGWSDATLARKVSFGGQSRIAPMAPGVPPEAVEETLLLDYGSHQSLDIIKQHLHELAAVMVEPVQSRRPDLQPREFLQELRRITEESETVLIFDEMITGFRSHPAGVQGLFGIQADLATYGKVIGGGLPIGAVAGKAEFMDALDGGAWNFGDGSYPQADRTLVSGAFFKHPLAMAAVVAILDYLKTEGPVFQERLNERTARLAKRLNDYFQEVDAPLEVAHFSSMFRFYFADEFRFQELFYYHLINKGVFAWEGGTLFLTPAHTDEDVEVFIRSVKQTIEDMRSGDLLPPPRAHSADGATPAPDDKQTVEEMRSGGLLPPSRAHSVDGATPAPVELIERPRSSGASSVRTIAVESETALKEAEPRARTLQFSLYYFGLYDLVASKDKYDLLIEGARFADEHGFTAVWLPERHFDAVGGFSPNPSVVAAALARETRRIKLRAGSVVLPLHHPVRVAEEWSVVDNLSGGRVGVSFASGWRPDDFVFAPDSFEKRHETMYRGIDVVRRLWRGEEIDAQAGAGKRCRIKLYPMPVQSELPTWLTMGRVETGVKAGEIGAAVLTNLQDQTLQDLSKKIKAYRESLAKNGFDPKTGHVTVLLHTFIGEDLDLTRRRAREPFCEYLRRHFAFSSNSLTGLLGNMFDPEKVDAGEMQFLLSRAFDRYAEGRALIGTADSCSKIVESLIEIEVDEIGCFIDFGIDTASVLDGLRHLNKLAERYSHNSRPETSSSSERSPLRLRSSGGQGRANVRAEDDVNRVAKEPLYVPLTESQKQIWALAQMGDELSRAYNESVILHLRGPFNLEAMSYALDEVVARHYGLRLTFSASGDYQLVHAQMPVAVAKVAFSGLAESERETNLAQWIKDQEQKVFDLALGPLYRFGLARMSEQHHALVMVAHHIIIDGNSWGVLLEEIRRLYSSRCQGVDSRLATPMRFEEFIEREEGLHQGTDDPEIEAYWLKQFEGGIPDLKLPTDRPRPPYLTFNRACYFTKTTAEVGDALKEVSSAQGGTLFATLMGGMNLLLHQLTGQRDIVVGINTAAPPSLGDGRVITYRVNPLALRCRLDGDPTIKQYLAYIRKVIFGAYEHRDYSLNTLARKLNLRHDRNRFTFVSAGLNLDTEGARMDFFGLDVEVLTNPTTAPTLDLYLDFMERNGELRLRCNYNADLFEPRTIERWIDHLITLLKAITSDPQRLVSTLPTIAHTLQPVWPQTRAMDVSDLTAYQLLMWMGHQLNPGEPVYVNALAFNISAEVDPQHFQKAFQTVFNSCDALRTVIEERDSVPYRKVLPISRCEVESLDLSTSLNPRQEAQVWMRQRARVPFDLERRMFHSALIKISDREYIYYLLMHHIIIDASGAQVLFRLLSDCYERSLMGRLEDRVTAPQFSDHVENERKRSTSHRYLKAEAYWKEKLAEEFEPLAFYGKVAQKQTSFAERISCDLGAERSRKLRAIAATKRVSAISEDASLFNTFGVVLCVYLHLISGSRRITLGVPFHNRLSKADKQTVGLFMKILPLRVTVGKDDSFASLIAKFAREYLEAHCHHEYPIGNPTQRKSYEVEYNYMNMKFPAFLGAPKRVDWIHLGHGTESLAAQVHDFNQTGSFTIEFDLNCDLFNREQRQLTVRHFLQVVDAFLEDESRPIGAVSALPAAEERHVLTELNQTETELPHYRTFSQLFEVQAELTPHRVAVACEDQALTYSQLNARANRLARHLIALRVKPDVIVALQTRRGIDLLTTILAVFKAGGAYLPLDPFHPAARISQIIDLSKTSLILATAEFLPVISDALCNIPSHDRPQVMELERLIEKDESAENLPSRSAPANLSYVIFTSGSTGIPKGVMIEQIGMVNHLVAKVKDLRLTSEDVIAQTSSQCFDISVWQLLAALLVGGQVHVVGDEVVRTPLQLLELLETKGISVFETVPSLLWAILEETERLGASRHALSGLRWLLVTGEALPPDLCHRWLQFYSNKPIINAYGPTECSDDVTHYALHKAPAPHVVNIPIGRPVANTRIYLLDESLQPLPIGVPGELFVGGRGVGRGYLHDASRTAEVFIPDPFADEQGSRLYRSGDMSRHLPDGNIEFLGRKDNQVKVRGHRIELGEIEVALRQHWALREAAVTLREDSPGDKRLVAYLVPASTETPALNEVRSFLKERLPEYMLPAFFVVLDALPLTPNGKVDMRALPPPAASRAETEETLTPPRTRTEDTLARIWKQVLGVDQVGIYDNFFYLGGDSILSIQVAAKANQAGVRLTPMQVFQYQTIAELAEIAGTAQLFEAEQGIVTGTVPLTPAQHWFFDQDIVPRHHWNMAILLETEKLLDSTLVEKIARNLIEHHDALRLRFVNTARGWQQTNAGVEETVPLSIFDLSSVPDSELAAAIESMATDLQKSLNLSDGPFLRFGLLDLGPLRTGRLMIVVHHLAVDGVSWGILLEDLGEAYRQASRGQAIVLPPKTTSYKAWSEKLTRYAASDGLQREIAYWLAEPRAKVKPLPLDYHLPNTKRSALNVSLSLGVEETRSLLQDLPKAFRTQINDVLLTALAQSFLKWTGDPLLLLELEGHGREDLFKDVDLSRTVGFFTTFFPVLVDIGGAHSLLDSLQSVKEQLQNIPKRGIGYGILRYCGSANVIERFKSLPLPEVGFNYLGQLDQALSEPGFFRPARESSGMDASLEGYRRHALDINTFVFGGQLRLDIIYSENLHRRSTIEALAEGFLGALRSFADLARSSDRPGYKDADFAEFNWSQSDVEEIAAAIGNLSRSA